MSVNYLISQGLASGFFVNDGGYGGEKDPLGISIDSLSKGLAECCGSGAVIVREPFA